MKHLQYKFAMEYSKKEIMQVFGILLKSVMTEITTLKRAGTKVEVKDFAMYPLNATKIMKLRKVLLVSSSAKGAKILDKIDTAFMKEVEKLSLRVVREEFIS